MKSGLIVGFCLLSILHSCNAANPTMKPETIDQNLKNGVDGTDKIKLRYFTNNDYTNSDANAPILVHLTYDEDAETSNDHHGYIFSIAKQLNASVAILEHRYFGKSFVPGKDTITKYTDIENIGPAEAVADFSAVITKIRSNNNQRKVILSGSGYAAELATIMRLNDKTGNDQVFYASIISNAPLRLHQGSDVKLNVFDNKLAEIYKNEGCTDDKLKTAIDALVNNVQDADKDKIVATLKLNDDGDTYFDSGKLALVNYIYNAYVGLAQQNYDMSRKVGVLTYPARPLKDFCKKVTDAATGTDIEKKIIPVQLLIEAYYQNSDLTDNKHNYKDVIPDLRKNYVDCTITSPYHCSQGPTNDYFKKNCDNGDDKANWEKTRKSYCRSVIADFNPDTAINFDTMKTQLKDFKFGDLKNVIYINGENDPNNVGTVTSVDSSKAQYKFDIGGVTASAHLITPTSCDPDNVKEVRFRTINLLNCWLTGTTTGNCDSSKFTAGLPNYAPSSDTTTCSDQTFNYPWGRDVSDPGKGGSDSTTKKPSNDKTDSMASSVFFAHIPLLTFVIYMFFA